mmetsp:Transcript_31052/g.58220  ORF Transcript_31052/g.58220 Transcript_31052/m.58220 type:complete len:289 (-) Transcript_31052:50-916(-)
MPDAFVAMDAAVEVAVKRVMEHTEFAGKFKHPVKFNGTDFVEQRLTKEQQLAEVTRSASHQMHVFLERYGSMLGAEDLQALARCPSADTAEARIWLERLLKEPPSDQELAKRRRRRRWVWAKREMANSEGFFSEEEMKQRDPQLFHHIVGQYQDSTVKLSDPMQGSLSNYLMQQLERQCEEELRGGTSDAARDACPSSAKRQRVEEARPDVDMEFTNEDYYDASGDEGGSGGADDAAVRRARFLKAMRDKFMDGMERNFDYTVLDDDSDLDDVVELGRDAEEKYFDTE